MPQVCRQDRQAALYVLTGPVPLDQGLDGKSVSKIVQPGAMTVGGATQSDLPGEVVKRSPDIGAIESCTTTGHEENLRPSRQKTITPGSIVRENRAGRRMNRYQARLAKLRSPNRENALIQIHVVGLQVARLADAQARHRQQP